VRTSGRRYAYLRVLSATSGEVSLDVTVWDPPFATGGQ